MLPLNKLEYTSSNDNVEYSYLLVINCVSVFPAAVTALAKFGAHCEELLNSCVVLLERYVCAVFSFLRIFFIIDVAMHGLS